MGIRSISELELDTKHRAREERSLALLKRAGEIAKTMRCNCDLDNWQPELSTGHSWVCRIHKAAIGQD